MGAPPYEGDWQKKTITQRSYLARFGGEVHRSRFGASGKVAGSLLFSREYTLADRVNVIRGIVGSMRLSRRRSGRTGRSEPAGTLTRDVIIGVAAGAGFCAAAARLVEAWSGHHIRR